MHYDKQDKIFILASFNLTLNYWVFVEGLSDDRYFRYFEEESDLKHSDDSLQINLFTFVEWCFIIHNVKWIHSYDFCKHFTNWFIIAETHQENNTWQSRCLDFNARKINSEVSILNVYFNNKMYSNDTYISLHKYFSLFRGFSFPFETNKSKNNSLSLFEV